MSGVSVMYTEGYDISIMGFRLSSLELVRHRALLS
jgi:hypothetical protein